MLNLSNAAKFVPTGSGRWMLTLSCDGERLRDVTVKDNRPGIEPAQRRWCSKFRQGGTNLATTGVPAWGAADHAQIVSTSAVGCGWSRCRARRDFILPPGCWGWRRARDDAGDIGRGGDADGPESAVADVNRTSSFAGILRKAAGATRSGVANDGEEAVRDPRLATRPGVLLDVMMPKKSGFESARNPFRPGYGGIPHLIH